MRLANRLSAFFLVALALVLIGFSTALYVLARSYLRRCDEERMQLALDVLEASVDIEPGGLEWEPIDRRMTLGVDHSVDAVRWAVRDECDRPVDRSTNCPDEGFPSDWRPEAWPTDPTDDTVFGAVPGWRLAARRLELMDLLRQGRGHPDDEPGFEEQFEQLVLMVGLSPEPTESALARLGRTLAVLSALVWGGAAAAGRWLCDRALEPLRRMAEAATAMTAQDRSERLPIEGTGDELDAMGVAFNDLLERLHLAFVQLDEAYQRQGRFASDASHQLRTPLAAMLGQAQVALRRDRPAEDYRRVLEVIRSEGDRLRQVVDSLLALAQPDGHGFATQAVDLAQWSTEQVKRWSVHPRAADLRHVAPPAGELVVDTRPPLLSQILDNLIENAFKYSAPGTDVVVEVGRDGDAAVVKVSDRGLGLTPEEAAEAFTPFFRGERARRAGLSGVGLGLSVAERLASSLGGTLSVSSEPGRGSEFVLHLPTTQGGSP